MHKLLYRMIQPTHRSMFAFQMCTCNQCSDHTCARTCETRQLADFQALNCSSWSLLNGRISLSLPNDVVIGAIFFLLVAKQNTTWPFVTNLLDIQNNITNIRHEKKNAKRTPRQTRSAVRRAHMNSVCGKKLKQQNFAYCIAYCVKIYLTNRYYSRPWEILHINVLPTFRLNLRRLKEQKVWSVKHSCLWNNSYTMIDLNSAIHA